MSSRGELGLVLTDHESQRTLPSMEDPPTSRKFRWEQLPWWALLLIILFPLVLRPWWAALISIAVFILFLRLILGPFPVKGKQSD